MWLYLLVPVVTGICIVLQGGLNRLSAGQIGLLSAVFINAIVFFAVAACLWFFGRSGFFSLPDSLGAGPIRSLKWWQFLPGIFGLLIVLLIPLAIMHLGAGMTFSLVIATQLLASFVWDSVRQQSWPSLAAWAGLGLILLGSVILIRSTHPAN